MSEEELERNISLLEATMIGLGGTTGIGFILVGHAVGIAGPAAVFSFILGFIITLFTGFSYSELAASLPIAGGGYSFAKEAIKGIGAFITGWFMWFGNMVYSALSAVTFGFAVSEFVPIPSPIIALATVGVFTVLNIFSSKETGRTQAILTISLVALLTIITAVGFGKIDKANFIPLIPEGEGSIFHALGYAFVCYIGFEILSTTSSEIKNPGKNIPRAILWAIGLSAVIYISFTVAMAGNLSYASFKGARTPILNLGEVIFGKSGKILALAAITIGSLSTLNAAMAASGRVAYALGRDKYLPEKIERVHPEYNTPYIAILVSAGIISVFAVTGLVNLIAYLSDFGYLVGLTLINLSVIFLRRKRKKLERPFKVPLYPLVPLLGAGSSLVLIPALSSQAFIVGITWLIVGLLAYYLLMLGKERIRLTFGGVNILIGFILIAFPILSYIGLISLPGFIVPLSVALTLLGTIFTSSGIIQTLKA